MGMRIKQDLWYPRNNDHEKYKLCHTSSFMNMVSYWSTSKCFTPVDEGRVGTWVQSMGFQHAWTHLNWLATLSLSNLNENTVRLNVIIKTVQTDRLVPIGHPQMSAWPSRCASSRCTIKVCITLTYMHIHTTHPYARACMHAHTCVLTCTHTRTHKHTQNWLKFSTSCWTCLAVPAVQDMCSRLMRVWCPIPNKHHSKSSHRSDHHLYHNLIVVEYGLLFIVC